VHRNNLLKELIKPLRLSMYNFSEKRVKKNLSALFQAVWQRSWRWCLGTGGVSWSQSCQRLEV